jgi:hypothetical protein
VQRPRGAAGHGRRDGQSLQAKYQRAGGLRAGGAHAGEELALGLRDRLICERDQSGRVLVDSQQSWLGARVHGHGLSSELPRPHRVTSPGAHTGQAAEAQGSGIGLVQAAEQFQALGEACSGPVQVTACLPDMPKDGQAAAGESRDSELAGEFRRRCGVLQCCHRLAIANCVACSGGECQAPIRGR